MPFQCRRQRRDDLSWNNPVQHVLDLIFARLWQDPALNSIIAKLRLVSKAWRDAVQRSPWRLQFHFKGSMALESMCKALPSMSTLDVQCRRLGTIRLDPLLNLTELTSLQLQGKMLQDEDENIVEPYAELRFLPSALQTLDINTVFVDPASFSEIRCPKLTNLFMAVAQNTDKDIAELLGYLPALKV